MIVVSDTTPLITLMKIGHLDLLEKTFGEIQIPEAVYTELTSNPRFQTDKGWDSEESMIHDMAAFRKERMGL